MHALLCMWQMRDSKHMGKVTPAYSQVMGPAEACWEEGRRWCEGLSAPLEGRVPEPGLRKTSDLIADWMSLIRWCAQQPHCLGRKGMNLWMLLVPKFSRQSSLCTLAASRLKKWWPKLWVVQIYLTFIHLFSGLSYGLITNFKDLAFKKFDLQYCVSFRCTAKWFSYIYYPWYIFLFGFFSIIGYYTVQNIVPCAVE